MFATVARGFAPAFAILITAWVTRSQCGSIKGGESISFRPPGWVFGVVWPVLYVTTGVAWAMVSKTVFATAFHQRIIDALLISILVLCCAWLPVYSCAKAKKASACILLVTALLSWGAFATVKGWQGWLLGLLALWTSFATTLNMTEAFGV